MAGFAMKATGVVGCLCCDLCLVASLLSLECSFFLVITLSVIHTLLFLIKELTSAQYSAERDPDYVQTALSKLKKGQKIILTCAIGGCEGTDAQHFSFSSLSCMLQLINLWLWMPLHTHNQHCSLHMQVAA